jgi:hypothetical protein
MTLDVLAGGYKRTLQTMAQSGRDVSAFAGDYQNIKSQADALKTSLGIGGTSKHSGLYQSIGFGPTSGGSSGGSNAADDYVSSFNIR